MVREHCEWSVPFPSLKGVDLEMGNAEKFMFVVVELPQTPEDDLGSTRAVCGKQTS